MRRSLAAVPLFLIPVLLAGHAFRESAETVDGGQPGFSSSNRLIIVIIDSLTEEEVRPELLPTLTALRATPEVTSIGVHTCFANFSAPCIMTTLEGRESPYATGLANISGGRSGPTSLPALASAAGMKVAIVGNVSLQSFYGRYASWLYSVDTLAPGRLSRDLAALTRAREYAANPDVQLLIVHLPGTDQAAHFYKPTSAAYSDHLRAIDDGLARLMATLRPADNLVVLGDHGHLLESGSHTRSSVAVFDGPDFRELFSAIGAPSRLEQRDLLFLLAYPLMLPLPPGFEGRYLFPVHSPSTWMDGALRPVDAYEALQRQTLAEHGFSGTQLEKRLQPDWEPDSPGAVASLAPVLPMICCLGLWLIVVYASPNQSHVLTTIVLAGTAIVTQRLAPAAGSVLAMLSMAAVAVAVAAPVMATGIPTPNELATLSISRQRGVTIAVLLLIAALGGLFMRPWIDFFLRLGNWPWGVPLLTLTMLAGGVLVARLRFGRLLALPSSMQLLVFTCLPSGFRFPLFSHNILRGYHVGAIATSIGTLARSLWLGRPFNDRRMMLNVTALAVLVVGGAAFFPQGGNLHWQLSLTRRLATAATPLAWMVFGIAAAVIAGAASRNRDRAILLATSAAAGGYALAIGQLPVAALATSFLVPAFVVALLVAVRPSEPDATPADTAEREGLILAGACVLALQIALGGFQVGQVDFAFSDSVASAFAGPSQYVVVTLLTIPKYTGAVIVLLAWYGLSRDRAHAAAAGGWLLFFLTLKLCALLLQIVMASLDQSEKLYELAIGDFMFVYGLLVCVAIFQTTGGVIRAVGDRCW